MSYDSSTTGRRLITAFFDSRQEANEAVERLGRAGIPRSSITLVEGSGAGTASPSREDEGFGFWEALKDLFLPDEDRAAYAEGLRRGGYVVTVQTDSALYDTAIDILDDEGTIDLDQRAQTWRQEGWTGTSGWSGLAPSPRASAADLPGPARATGAARAGAAVPQSGAPRTTQAAGGREEVIPVTEESLKVGKREVSHGRVRVRSYVVETPVNERVNLREEHVRVERRPVDRPATAADNLFRERTIEAEEKAEEAVVAKEARVKEELVVKKDVGQRTETVSDKVRRTEVEVEDERGKAIRSGERDTR
jgi:uncharacterized protein (TIGR02271 family)